MGIKLYSLKSSRTVDGDCNPLISKFLPTNDAFMFSLLYALILSSIHANPKQIRGPYNMSTLHMFIA